MGLTYFKRFRMEIDLTGRDWFAPQLPSGYQLHCWDHDLLEHHAFAKYMSFRSELDANVFPCLGEFDGCFRLMTEIQNKEGFLPGATWLLSYQSEIDRLSDFTEPEYCGTVQGICDRHGIGAIQNLGVVPGHRGLGLGRALMIQALRGFQSAELHRAFLEVTSQNEGAVQLYEDIGFRRVRTVYKAVELASVG